jgi:hypothetical protein
MEDSTELLAKAAHRSPPQYTTQDLWDQHLDGSTSKIPWR